MKILVLLFLFTSAFSISLAQFDNYPRENNGELKGGAGLNWIDGKLHYSLSFRPEISFANFGAGLDLKFDINQDGELRKENFNEMSDYLSIIRYVRYGLKNDPLYIKLGALDYYSLGHGSIMYRYNNSPSYDARKIGVIVDMDFGMAGFETIYSRFAEAGVFGIRGFTRPFRFTGLATVPIIKNIETGISYAADFNSYAGVTSGFYDPVKHEFITGSDEGSIEIVGIDIGIPIALTSLIDLELYVDYTSILNFGSGTAIGALFNTEALGLLEAYARLERRFNGKNYIPSYFNSLYEIERFRTFPPTSAFTGKALALQNVTESVHGYFGEAGVRFLNIFQVTAGYQSRDQAPRDGVLFVFAEVVPEELPFIARAGYDKIKIESTTQIFELDDNSFLFTELGYKPLPFVVVSLVYSWTYTPLRDDDKVIIGYEPIKRIEPRISFIYPFTF